MLAQFASDINPTIATVIGGFILTHIGAILGGYLSIRDRLVRIETKLDMHEKDLDGLGLFLGTQRALSQQEKKQ